LGEQSIDITKYRRLHEWTMEQFKISSRPIMSLLVSPQRFQGIGKLFINKNKENNGLRVESESPNSYSKPKTGQ